MAGEFISMRGLSLLLPGMAGSVVGSQMVKTGADPDMTTFLYSETKTMICFIVNPGNCITGF